MAVRGVIEITKVEQNAGSEIVFLCFYVRFCTRVDKKKKKKKWEKRRERENAVVPFHCSISGCWKATQRVLQEKHRERERKKNSNRDVCICTERGWNNERQREERHSERGCTKETCGWRLLSFSSHCSPFVFFFFFFLLLSFIYLLYLIVPFPNFTLQIPLLTLTKVDAVVIHLANLPQIVYKEHGVSLRYLSLTWYVIFTK